MNAHTDIFKSVMTEENLAFPTGVNSNLLTPHKGLTHQADALWDSNLRPAGQCSDPRDAKSAVGWGTLEFPGQLIALLLVAQWLERWCVN